MRKLFGIILVVCGFFLLFVTITNSGMSSWFFPKKEERQSISLLGTETVNINVNSANVKVIAQERDNVEAVLHERKANRAQLHIDQKGSTVHITIEKKNWPHFFTIADHLSLEVFIPQEYNEGLIIQSKSGNVQVSGSSPDEMMSLSRLELDVLSGNTQLHHIQAKQLKHSGTSGNLKSDWLIADDAAFQIFSGNITLQHYSGALQARLTSGNLELSMDAVHGPVDVETTSGNTSLYLPADANITLEGRVTSGKIRSGFPLDSVNVYDEKTLNGSAGTGEHSIQLRALSGNITVRSSAN